MKLKSLIVLVVIAAALIALAVRSQRQKTAGAADVAGKPILPDLPVNDVEKLVITSPQETVTVARVAEEWVVADRYNYPADFGKLKGLLLKLADLKIGQAMTLDASQKPGLKMAMPGSGPEAGTRVELLGSGGRRVAGLLVGVEHKRAAKGEAAMYGGYADGCYVSADEGRTVYLVPQTLSEASDKAREWLTRDLANVEPSEISAVTVTGADGAALRFTRPADGGSLKLEGLADKEELDAGKVSSLENALSFLRADDVADPKLSEDRLGLTNATVFSAETKKGEVYTARVGGPAAGAGQRHLRLEVALKPAAPLPPAPAAGTNAAAAASNEVAAAKAAADERKKLEENAATLTRKLKAWTFLVDAFKADAMTPTRAALVKEKKAEEKPEAAGTNAAAAAGAPVEVPPAAPPAPAP